MPTPSNLDVSKTQLDRGVLAAFAINSSSLSTKSRLNGFIRQSLSFAGWIKPIGQAQVGEDAASVSTSADQMGAIAEEIVLEQSVEQKI